MGLADEQGFPHEGRMDFVDNQLDPATGTIRARAVLDNHSDPRGGRPFTPGLFARIKLLGSGTFSAVLVDDKAILTDQDRRYVFVLGAGNTAERRDVRLGRIIDGLRVVTGGLDAGDRIIVHGVQKVFSRVWPSPHRPSVWAIRRRPAPAPASDGGEPAAPAKEPNA